MSALWHDSGAPSFMSNAPAFSFYDVAEICEPAPASWQEQREKFRAFEKKKITSTTWTDNACLVLHHGIYYRMALGWSNWRCFFQGNV